MWVLKIRVRGIAMRIKLAILDHDERYLARIANAFGNKYADKLYVRSSTNPERIMAELETERIDVLLVNDAYDFDASLLPKRCGFAYFVDSPDIEMKNGEHAVCKYQSVDMIYKQILGLYSEHAGNVASIGTGDGKCKIAIFQPVSGGVGSSSLAAACATRLARKGSRTLYLNVEKLGTSDTFFSARGQFDMSDIITALKMNKQSSVDKKMTRQLDSDSTKPHLEMKLESCVRQADCGVYFYAGSQNALHTMELTFEEITRLLDTLARCGSYDCVVVDMDFSLTREAIEVYCKAKTIVWVGDGSELSNNKLYRAYNALIALEQDMEVPIMNRIAVAYNKLSNKTGRILTEIELKNLGSFPRVDRADTEQVQSQLASAEFLDRIV